MSAGQIAYHLAFVPGGVVRFVQSNPAQGRGLGLPQPASRQEVLDAFEESITAVRSVLPTFDDPQWARHDVWLSMDRKSWSNLTGSSCVTSCSAFGASIGVNSACSCGFSIFPCRQVGGPSADEPPAFMPKSLSWVGANRHRTFVTWFSFKIEDVGSNCPFSFNSGAPRFCENPADRK